MDSCISNSSSPYKVSYQKPLGSSSNHSSPLSPVSPTSVCPRSSSSSSFLSAAAASATKARRRGSARSMSSSMTDWSTATAPTSNTTLDQQEKKRQKNRFMKFARVLLQFLERKDPAVFAEAQAVIRDCEEQKRRGQIDSLSDSVKAPLKDLVGPSYWKEARRYSKKLNPYSSEEFEPLSMTEEPPTFSQDELAWLEQCLRIEDQQHQQPAWMFPLTTKSCATEAEEMKLRRERFWMLIRVLMKYLEKTDPSTFRRARKSIESCIQRHKKLKEGYPTLMRNVQRELKEIVGVGRWRRAEAYLAKILIRRADEAALEVESPYSNTRSSSSSKNNIYDLEMNEESLKSFGGPESWEEGIPRCASPSSEFGRNANNPELFSSNRDFRSMHKRTRPRDRDRFSLMGRSRSPSLGSHPLVATALDPKRRRLHNLD